MNAKTSARWYARRPLWVALAAAVLLVAAAWVALLVAFPPERQRAILREQLSRSLRREARFEDVSVSLWPPVRLGATQLELAEPGGFAEGVALNVPSLHLDLDAWQLLRRRLVVRRLALVQPVLHLVLRGDGGTNFDSLAATGPARGGAPMDLEMSNLLVRGGEVLVDDLHAGRRIFFGLDTRLGFSAAGGARFATRGRTELSRLAVGPLSARRLADLNQGLAKLTWVVEHDGSFDADRRLLTLAKLSLAFGRARLGVSGTVLEPGPRPALDLRVRGERVDLGDLLSYLAAADAQALHGIGGSGRLDFDLHVVGRAGPGAIPSLEGRLAVVDGAFRYPKAPAGVEGLAFAAQLAPDRLEIAELRARVAGQPLRAQLEVQRFADPQVRFAVQGAVDLAAVAPLLAPKDTRLAGRAELNLRGSGRAKDPGSIALEGRAQLEGVSVETPGLPKKVEGIAAAIEFSQAHASVRGFSARAGQSSFRMNAGVSRPLALMAKPGKAPPAGLEFGLTSPYLDLAELVPPGPGGPIALNARGGGRIAIARLKNDKLDVSDLAASVAVEPGALALPSFSLAGYGGRITGSARLGFADPARPSFAVKGRADSVQADAFLSAWSPAKGILNGTVSTDFDFAGEGTAPAQVRRTLTAIGRASLSDGRLGGPVLAAIAQVAGVPQFAELRFRDLKLPFRVESGRVVTDSVRIGSHNGDWLVSGRVGFDGALDYAVSVTVPPEVAAKLGRKAALAAGVLGDERGRLLLDFRVGGTAKAPRVGLDNAAMRARLAGRASSLLAEQRAKLRDELLRASLGARDSSGKVVAPVDTKQLGRDLEKQGRELLQGLFGKKKPALRESASGDSTRR